jgi:4-hydroxy-2-oxoheptanedioate aldolase
MQMPFRLKPRLASGTPVVGTFVFSSDPASTEIAALAGCDFVVVDREHTALSWSDVQNHCRAAEARGISLLVRTRSPSGEEIAKALDVGAEGAVVPHFGLDREASIRCVRSARFNPEGDRGTCTGTRPGLFGLGDFSRTVAEANRDALVVVQIEDAEVLPDLDALFAEVRVDAVMPGLADLSTSLGKPGRFSDPEVIEAANSVFTAAEKAGLPVGVYIANAGETARWAGTKANFFVYAIDHKVLAEGYRTAVDTVRQGLAMTG